MTIDYNDYNFFQASQFAVTIDKQRFASLQYYAQRLIHPGIAVSGAQVPVSRLTTIYIPGDTLNFDELQMDILLDEEWKSYSEFNSWLQSLTQERSDYTANTFIESDITVVAFNSHNNKSKTIKYINCVPTSVGAITFDATVGDTEVITFPVTFKIDFFEIT